MYPLWTQIVAALVLLAVLLAVVVVIGLLPGEASRRSRIPHNTSSACSDYHSHSRADTCRYHLRPDSQPVIDVSIRTLARDIQ